MQYNTTQFNAMQSNTIQVQQENNNNNTIQITTHKIPTTQTIQYNYNAIQQHNTTQHNTIQ